MKQMNLFTFLTKLSTNTIEKSNKEDDRIVRFSKSASKQLSSEIENKENRSPKIFKQQKIGKLLTRLNTIEYCDNSKEDDGDDSELEVINDLAKGLNLERKERSIMEAHRFYSNAAVCLPSWEEPNQLTIHQLEADEVALSIDGESHMRRTFGGAGYSDSVGKISRKRTRSCLISSDDECDEGDFLKPQTEDNQWIVEKVLARRVVMERTKSRSIQYFLKWKGWDYKHSTWEIHCKENNIQDLVMEFHDREVWRDAICRRVPYNERLYFYNSYMLGSLINCHQWEDEMNNLIKSKTPRQAPIYVENWVDEEAKPKKFQFILENRFSKETEKALVGIPNIEHCKCGNEKEEQCGSKHDCCPYNFNQNYCYLEDGRIDSKQTYMNKYWIVECTDACKCGVTCPTRVVQRGRQIPIVIFRTLDRGWAVRTCVDIQKKSFVCEYVGEVLTDEESLESKKPSTYQFQMDGCGPKYSFIVDAAIYGNEARFVNHSCGPNLAVYPVFADRLDERYHRIAFFAKRDIKRGDELTIDYCAIDQFAKGRRQKQCNCKSKKCRDVFYA